jgi:hypothetical protein
MTPQTGGIEMRGPGLTTTELIAYLTFRIQRFERLGWSREEAIRAIAIDDKTFDEEKIVAILSKFSNDSDLAA